MDVNLSDKADMLAKYGVESYEELKRKERAVKLSKNYCSVKSYMATAKPGVRIPAGMFSRLESFVLGMDRYYTIRSEAGPYYKGSCFKICFKLDKQMEYQNSDIACEICPMFKI